MTKSPARDLVRLLLRRNRIIRVATISPSGEPTVAPVWYGFGDDDRIAITMPDSATVRNIVRTGEATVLVDEGSGYADLRGAIVETTAKAYGDDEAPDHVRIAIEAADARYGEEIAEARAVRAIDYPGRRTAPRATYRLELVPRRARWFTLGGSITGTVQFDGDAPSSGGGGDG
jgi:hypothetical protein